MTTFRQTLPLSQSTPRSRHSELSYMESQTKNSSSSDSAISMLKHRFITMRRFLIAAVIPSLASIDWFITKKRRNLYLLPSFCQRLLALPYNGGRQRRSPTLVYAIKTSACIPPGTPCRMQDNYISTGIYRCSILDHCMNFARIPDSQESALINAFIMFHLPPSIPDRGFGRSASANIHNFIMEAERFMIFLLYICIYET